MSLHSVYSRSFSARLFGKCLPSHLLLADVDNTIKKIACGIPVKGTQRRDKHDVLIGELNDIAAAAPHEAAHVSTDAQVRQRTTQIRHRHVVMVGVASPALLQDFVAVVQYEVYFSADQQQTVEPRKTERNGV
jgi:hypothetical protein